MPNSHPHTTYTVYNTGLQTYKYTDDTVTDSHGYKLTQPRRFLFTTSGIVCRESVYIQICLFSPNWNANDLRVFRDFNTLHSRFVKENRVVRFVCVWHFNFELNLLKRI